MKITEKIGKKVFAGEQIAKEEAMELAVLADKVALYRTAGEIRDRFAGKRFDTCSIVNARSGKCSENCKWCAQSSWYQTQTEEYDLIPEEKCLEMAAINARYGVGKFSFVTSGRSLPEHHLEKIGEYARKISELYPLELCASMGLLTREQLRKLKSAGIERYHCNLESSANYFPFLCTTHTLEEKVQTIRYAKEAGMEVCSGGIIGMGEKMEDRIDMALLLRELGVKSIPINILNPIPGTPLEKVSPLSDDEILITMAIFRFIHPDAWLRFAGGRILIEHLTHKAIQAGMNAAIMGDMLTTPGAKIEEDMEMVKGMGFECVNA